jgi:ceramide glucosyltransferase
MIQFFVTLLRSICLIPVVGGSVYVLLCLLAVFRFRNLFSSPTPHSFSEWPPVTILKPVYGLEKNQQENLRSACLQDYPEFQVVFSVQDLDDPAIPLLKEIQQEFGEKKVSVAIENLRIGTNGKVNNLLGALPYARNDILIISDSDVYLKPDYLKTIVTPLTNPETGGVCTLYRGKCAERWFEKMEMLTFNADFIPSVIFAHISGASKFCTGASLALSRDILKKIGGLESLSDYLVEDYEIGRRIWSLGKKVEVVPYFVDIVIDYKNFSQWWNHQVYWDQNLRAARPVGFFASILTRSVPFAFLFAALSQGGVVGLVILAVTLGLRLVTTAAIMWELRDYEGLRSLPLLPLRDMAGLISWFLSFTKRSVLWRGSEFILTRDGRLISRKAKQEDSFSV